MTGRSAAICTIYRTVVSGVAEIMAKALSGSGGDATGIVAAATFSE